MNGDRADELVREAKRHARRAQKDGNHVQSAQHYIVALLFTMQSERISYVEVLELLQLVRDAVCVRSSEAVRHPYAGKPKTRKEMRETREYL